MSEQTAKQMINDLDKSQDIEDCVPCKVSVAIGLLLGSYCDMETECVKLADDVLDGKITLRDMAEQLQATDTDLDAFESKGVPLDEKRKWRDEMPDEKEDDFVTSVNKINEQYQKEKNTQEGGDI